MLTPLGVDVASTWEGIKAGKSGIRNIEHFDTEPFATRFAGLVPDFDISEYLSPKDARKMDVFVQYGWWQPFRRYAMRAWIWKRKMPSV